MYQEQASTWFSIMSEPLFGQSLFGIGVGGRLVNCGTSGDEATIPSLDTCSTRGFPSWDLIPTGQKSLAQRGTSSVKAISRLLLTRSWLADAADARNDGQRLLRLEIPCGLSRQIHELWASAPYPELKKSLLMARTGRPWTDFKPPPSAPVWAAVEGLGRYYILLAAIELDVSMPYNAWGRPRLRMLRLTLGRRAPSIVTRWCRCA